MSLYKQELKEIRECFADLAQQMAELDAKVEAEEQEPMFPVIEPHQEYYFINAIFGVGKTFYGCSQDKLKIAANNAYTLEQKGLCESVAKHIADTNWFIRAAKMFAEGYEFEKGGYNYFVVYDANNKGWDMCCDHRLINATSVYMSKHQADKFIAWLDKHKPNGLGG